MSAPERIRTVTIVPPQASGETLWVVRAVFVIVIVAYFAIGLRRTGPAQAAAPGPPWQVAFHAQSGEVQRVVRELLAAYDEAVPSRTPDGRWPGVDRLAADLVPPFAPVPGRPADCVWEQRRKSVYVNYLGVPAAGSGRPAFLLLIQEPEPEMKGLPHPGPADEFHRKLADGTILHVAVWYQPEGRVEKDVIWIPEKYGWKQILTGRQ